MAANTWKEWMQGLIELEELIEKLRQALDRESEPSEHQRIEARLKEFERRRDVVLEVITTRMGPWEEVLMARAEPRPYTLDYIELCLTDFIELSGDRRYGDDKAIVGGTAFLDGQAVVVVGHQKGRNLQERTFRNFGMAKPEGYRKAMRLFRMAEQFRLPVVTFVDTPAADPGVESESRGISEAIAESMRVMFSLTVPVVSVVIGEGGSGGAIGIAVANKVLMLEHAIYSVIPPEGCAAILWRDAKKGPEAAAALRLTAKGAHEFMLVDRLLEEPFGGAHRDPASVGETVKKAIVEEFEALSKFTPSELREQRYSRFRRMGMYETA
ncbi:MAG: acetyl-CoA carboxylase carboxyltransferase subunit alpha [Fimbriimonadaceae bacterium]|nr:acetyl-CoA carboxylase carboxyltransferase subunit alpha [Fimbriimonadaceae bacterium]QYK54754.1 MAG: acetyl-CoA carboxylase carboxyltransferase subunit alpha [Fimbriimonadaceae bacterium]